MRRFAISFGLLIFGSGFASPASSSWEESHRNAAAAREQGRFADARRWFETALNQAQFGDGDLRRADLDDELAGVCQLMGDDTAAERLYADALKVLDKHPDDGADVRSIVWGGLGLFRARQGRLAEADDVLQKALASAKLAFGPKDPRLASVQSSLGQILVMEGKLADAKPLLQTAIKVYEAMPESMVTERLVAEGTLGTLYMTEGLYAEAESILSHANEEASALGKPLPVWGGVMAALADFYRLEGKSSRTEPLLKKSQAIYETAFGRDSPRVAEILLDRSIDSLGARKLAIAKSQITQALEILRKANGPDHPTVALAEFRLAQAYTLEGKYAEAEPLLWHALSVQEKTYPEGHFLVGDSRLQLAEVERLRQDYPDAEQQYRGAIGIYEKIGNPGSARLAVALRQYAKLLRTRRTEEAKVMEKRAEGIQRSVETFR